MVREYASYIIKFWAWPHQIRKTWIIWPCREDVCYKCRWPLKLQESGELDTEMLFGVLELMVKDHSNNPKMCKKYYPGTKVCNRSRTYKGSCRKCRKHRIIRFLKEWKFRYEVEYLCETVVANLENLFSHFSYLDLKISCSYILM